MNREKNRFLQNRNEKMLMMLKAYWFDCLCILNMWIVQAKSYNEVMTNHHHQGEHYTIINLTSWLRIMYVIHLRNKISSLLS